MATENFGLPDPTTTPKMPKVSKTKGGTIKVETMSLNQFRSYLKGIMFVGGPTWRPDRDQWEAIVAIIDKLTVDAPQQQAAAYTQPVYTQPAAAAGWDQQAPSWTPMPASPRSAMDTVNEDGGTYVTPFV
jgi:hypothetical protein